MNCATEARKLADYIVSLGDSFPSHTCTNQFYQNHIGALYTDIVLQAGLNYNTVVKPRVQNIITRYYDFNTVSSFNDLVINEGLQKIINWNHPIKLSRIQSLIDFSFENNIDSWNDLKAYLSLEEHQQNLLELSGVGPKTLDYLMKILGFDIVAVDRHILLFVEMAEIKAKGYSSNKKIVEYAADFLNLPRKYVDYNIWRYMSEKIWAENSTYQIVMDLA